MKRITEITRREIVQLFKEGIEDDFPLYDHIEIRKITYCYYGKLSEIEFLDKLYPLEEMPSYDSRFHNAKEDIIQHTVANEDWDYDWFFKDPRFDLIQCNDENFLSFLCTVFHPAVRQEDEPWRTFLQRIQELLHADCYELYIEDYISQREKFHWRELTVKESKSSRFLPFSIRYDDKKIESPRIKRAARKKIIELMYSLEEMEYITDESGFNDNIPTTRATLETLRSYYTPLAFNEANQYIETNDFTKLILNTSPKTVFDIIEIYETFRKNGFEYEINKIIGETGYKLIDGKIMFNFHEIHIEIPKETTLKEMIEVADTYYKSGETGKMQIALEKAWDVLERIKTSYSTDKKKSVTLLINKISMGNEELSDLLSQEFTTLTTIGNKFQIRHFEQGKIPITNIKFKEYLFERCMAIINLSLKELN